MSKLLSADFARLWKNKVFWLEAAAMFAWGTLILISGHQTALAEPERVFTLETYFFQYAPFAGIFCAVFVSLFVGTDYSDGTIRNKIVVGHSRRDIYLSNVIVATAAAVMVNAAWVLAMFAIGIPLFGWFQSSPGRILAYLLIAVLMLAVFASVFTLLSMMNQNKAGVAVISLLVFLAIMFAGSYCNNKLHEPEMYSEGIVFSKEGMEPQAPTANPDYVTGNMRKVYEFGEDFLPVGQGILLSEMEAEHLWQMPLYSVVIILGTTFAGILCFRRKDIK